MSNRHRMRLIIGMFITSLVSGCGKNAYFQTRLANMPVSQRVLLIKEHCNNIAKGRLYFYRLNGRLIQRSKEGFTALWLEPGMHRVTMKFIAKGQDYRYIYTSYADINLEGWPGESYRVRYKRTKFKQVKIWLEPAGRISSADLPPSECMQHNYRIPRDWLVY